MEAPFIFGKIATQDNFTDREQETQELAECFQSLVNTIIISPRRWGKSSLVNKAAKIAMQQDDKLRVCMIDLFNVRNEEHFYSQFARKILNATASKWDEAVETAKSVFSALVPKISVSADPSSEILLDFNWDNVKQNPDEILDLAEKIAEKKGIKIVVCIDEFQNIAEFDEPDYLQRRLRAHWQLHKHVSYCLYGSKRHMMMDVFTNSSKPFYKFGNLMFLNKIDTPHWVEFIKKRFNDTNKSISDEAALLIANLADNHPYYVQQLAQLSWLRTTDVCNEEIVKNAHSALVQQLSLLFTAITETLTSQQLNYMHALLDNVPSITSTDTMKKYGISSATAASRAKDALIKNDVLDQVAGKLNFQDPIYAYWLKETYFGTY